MTNARDSIDFVCSAGYNPARWPHRRKPLGLDLRLIVSDLAVLDFNGPGAHFRARAYMNKPGDSYSWLQK